MGWRAVRRSFSVAVVIAIALAAPAHAASTSFSSSLEEGDAQPTWTNTAERASGVIGPARPGIPGNVTDTVVAVRASGENEDGGEVKENLVDGSEDSKWLVFEPTAWVELELADPVKVVRYALTSANDSAERDPRDWTLKGSNDGTTWTTLDTRSGEDFADRFQTREFSFDNDVAYRHYRLDITANHGDDLIQLAELQLSNGDTTPPPGGRHAQQPSAPGRAAATTPSRASASPACARCSTPAATPARAAATPTTRSSTSTCSVKRRTELSYLIYPDFERDDLSYPSTYASVDLAFTDGTFLSQLGAKDQHGARLSPRGQAASKTLYTNQWNLKRSRIGRVAAGKRIDRILVAYDNPDGPADFGGWIDDIKVGPAEPKPVRNRPSDWVVTTRGTNSSGGFSRGNNIPATAVPHGFNFWTPVTNAGTDSWLYEYQKANNADNLPTLQAFSLSHEPSPWMGDRQTFQVMPSAATGTPDADRKARALPFRHANETARPDYYGVRFENGIKTQIAPTDHAAIMRFSFTGASSSLIFDNVDDDSALTIDRANGVVTGWSDVRSGLSNGATRMFIYATFDKPIKADGMLPDGNRPSTGYARFDAKHGEHADRDVADRHRPGEAQPRARAVAERHRRERQAARAAPVGRQARAGRGRGRQRGPAHDALLEPLPALPVSQLGAREHGLGGPADVEARGAVVDRDAAEHADRDGRARGRRQGLRQQRVLGHLPDHVVGVLAVHAEGRRRDGRRLRPAVPRRRLDRALVVARLREPDDGDELRRRVRRRLRQGRAGARRPRHLRRRGQERDRRATGRSLEPERRAQGPDRRAVPRLHAVARVRGRVVGARRRHQRLRDRQHGRRSSARRRANPAERRRLAEEREYFLSRSQNYVNMFDPAIRFFQGRDASGRWKSSPADYDPLVWGHEHDYTETDGWNFAFHTPHDGQGLANLYGGRDALARKLDTFFSTPETAKFPGSYGGTIHEMIEARDVRMGQWGFSNQVSHHIPYMYDYTGQPSKTQAKVREALRRLYLGSEIGQGYAGDEDNGETSAWYLFGSLGFYPLQVGSENYAIGSPQFKRMTVHLENGRDLVVKARNNSRRNVYVQSLKLNGRRYDRAYLRHRDIARGGTLVFKMGPEPSDWATGKDALPPSVTKGDAPAQPLRDTTGGDDGSMTASGGEADELFDNDSSTVGSLAGSQPWVQYRFTGSRPVSFYTLTSGTADGGDPRAWVVKGSNDGERWKVLDERSDETFRWRSQTRPFKLARPGQLRLLPDRDHGRRRPARRGRAAQPGQGGHLAARHRRRPGGRVGGRDGAGEGDRGQLRRGRGERDGGGDGGRLGGRARERAVRAARERRVEGARVRRRGPGGRGPRHVPGAGGGELG